MKIFASLFLLYDLMECTQKSFHCTKLDFNQNVLNSTQPDNEWTTVEDIQNRFFLLGLFQSLF